MKLSIVNGGGRNLSLLARALIAAAACIGDSANADEKQTYAVTGSTTVGIDLLGMAETHYTDRIKASGSGIYISGPVTHGDLSTANPFLLMDTTANTYFRNDTGLAMVPLRVTSNGNWTHVMEGTVGGVYTNAPGFGHLDIENGRFSTTTYRQWGDANGSRCLALTNGCSVAFWNTILGNASYGAILDVDGGTFSAANIQMMSQSPSASSTATVQNATLSLSGYWNASGLFYIGNGCANTGTGTAGDCNVFVLGTGGKLLTKGLLRQNDPRGHVIFRGGHIEQFFSIPGKDNATANYGWMFENSGAGTLELEADGNPIALNTGTNNLLFLKSSGTHAPTLLSGAGGFEKRGTGTLTLNNPGGMASATMTGGVRVQDGTLKLAADSFFPPANTLSVAIYKTFDLDGHAASFSSVDGEGRIASSAEGGTLTIGADNSSSTFAAISAAGATIAKDGSGTLTVASADNQANFTVKAGTLKLAAMRPRGYRHYRFKIDATLGKSSSVAGVQLSEFKLLDGDTDITGKRSGIAYAPYNRTWSYPPDFSVHTSYANEIVTAIVDGSLDSKWLDYRGSYSRIANEGDELYIQIDYAGPTVATGYSWATANDSAPTASGSNDNCRDPSSWRLLASDDGENWIELDKRENMGPYVARKAWTDTFSVTYPAERYVAGLGVVTVEDGATFDARGAAFTCGGIVNHGGTILVDGGTPATLSAAAGEERQAVCDDSAISLGVVKQGAGTNTCVGPLAVNGTVAVQEGTLRCVAYGFSGKYFRMSIYKNRANINYTQFCEFLLYDKDGNRVNVPPFTKRPDGTAAADLEEKQVALLKAYTGTAYGETIDWAFDGLLWNPNGGGCRKYLCAQKPTAEEPIVFHFRLPATTADVHGFNFIAGNDDNGRRNPVTWKFEGSYDGVEWRTLDYREDDPNTPTANSTRGPAPDYVETPVYFNDGVPYPTANVGEPSDGHLLPLGEDAVVSVAQGAVLDLYSPAMRLKHLAVDCTAGAGTITRFTPEPGGTLDISSSTPVSGNFAVPLSILEIAHPENLAGWTVSVNGSVRSDLKPRWTGTEIVLVGSGITIIVK